VTEPVPPYSGDSATCLKCAHTEAATRYRAAGEPGSEEPTMFGPSDKGERLERQCWRCGYTWDEALNPPTT